MEETISCPECNQQLDVEFGIGAKKTSDMGADFAPGSDIEFEVYCYACQNSLRPQDHGPTPWMKTKRTS